MAVPKRRQSKTRSRTRRAANMRKKTPEVSYCPQCGAPTPSHAVCSNCGYYMGRTLVETED